MTFKKEMGTFAIIVVTGVSLCHSGSVLKCNFIHMEVDK